MYEVEEGERSGERAKPCQDARRKVGRKEMDGARRRRGPHSFCVVAQAQ